MKKSIFRINLKHKIIAIVSLIIIIGSFIFIFSSNNDLVENSKYHTRNKGISISRSLAYILKFEYFFADESKDISPLIHGILSDENILYCLVLDYNGNVIAYNKKLNLNKEDEVKLVSEVITYKEEFVQTKYLNNKILYYDIIVPIYLLSNEIYQNNINTKKMGYVRIGITDNNLNKDLQDFRKNNFLKAIILIFIGIVFFVLSLNRLMNPFYNMIKNVNNIASGEYLHQKIKIKTNDELEDLADYINKLSEKIIDEMKYSSNIIQTIPDSVVIVDSKKRISYCNPAITELTGYSINQIIDKPCGSILKTSFCNNSCILNESIATNKNIMNKEGYIINITGNKIPSTFSCAILKNSRGELLGGIVIIKNIASQKNIIDINKQQAKKSKEISFELNTVLENLKVYTNKFLSSHSIQKNNLSKQATAINNVSGTIKNTIKTSNLLSTNSTNITNIIKDIINTSESGKENIEKVIFSIMGINSKVKLISREIYILNTKIKEIGKITQTINEISRNTNLLALNAAIESAREAESGKGFSIVAEEIRKLAIRSSKATEDIQKLVFNLQQTTESSVNATEIGLNEVEEGVETLNQFSSNFEEILRQINNIYNAVKDIESSAYNQAKSIEKIDYEIMKTNKNLSKNVYEFNLDVEVSENMDFISKKLKDIIVEFDL